MIDAQNFRPVKRRNMERKGEGGQMRHEPALSRAGNRAVIKHNFGALLHHNRHMGGKGGNRPFCPAPLVPKGDMHGFALMIVIAIMSFLAAWTVFAAYFIGQSAKAWSGAIAREAVVQIMPVPGQDMEKALRDAVNITGSFGGVAYVHIVSRDETRALLAPWLGAKADIEALPVPRLIILKLDAHNPPDFEELDGALQQNIKGVRFDRQQIWADRLVQGAHIMLGGALSVFALVLAAMILTIIFATRGALAGNMHIIEVLHLIGADDRFVARQFDAYFFRTGFKGACLGGAAACSLFVLLFFWLTMHRATPEGSQITALFGRLTPDWAIFAGIIALIVFIACVTMAASHYTLMRRLRLIDQKSSSFFSDRG